MSDYSRSSSISGASNSSSNYLPPLEYFINPDLSKIKVIVTVTRTYELHPFIPALIESSYSNQSLSNYVTETKSSPITELSHFPTSSSSSPYLNPSSTSINKIKKSKSHRTRNQSQSTQQREQQPDMEMEELKDWNSLLGTIKLDHFHNSSFSRINSRLSSEEDDAPLLSSSVSTSSRTRSEKSILSRWRR